MGWLRVGLWRSYLSQDLKEGRETARKTGMSRRNFELESGEAVLIKLLGTLIFIFDIQGVRIERRV